MDTSNFRVLSLDIGTKRIGVAKWAAKLASVHPVKMVRVNTPLEAFEDIAKIARDFDATNIILGYPLMPNGKPGALAHLVLKWKAKLENDLMPSVTLWDERMTSKQAEKDLSQLGLTPTKKRELVDMAAAMHILENWLNSQDWYR